MIILFDFFLFNYHHEIVWWRSIHFQKLFRVNDWNNLKVIQAHCILEMISWGGIIVILYIDQNIAMTKLSSHGKQKNVMDQWMKGFIEKWKKGQNCGD